MDDGFPTGNGNVLKERIAWLRHRIRGLEEGTKLLAQLGAKANEQIRVHDEHFVEVDRRLAEIESTVEDVPVVKSEIADVKESLRAARNAGYAVVVALVGLIATILLQGGGGA